jgi:hypothetical protein
MFGFVLGTVCLFGLVGMAMGGGRHHFHGHHHGYAYGRRGFRGGRFARGGACGPRGGGCGPGEGSYDDEGGRFDDRDGDDREDGPWARGPGGPGAWGPGFAHFGGFGGGEGFARTARRVLRSRLGLRSDQEPVVEDAIRDVKAAIEELATRLKEGRADVADALRDEGIDDVKLDAVYAKQDQAIASARRDLRLALHKAHAVLDPEQRAKIADLLASGPARWM